jgi:hypothetical protein
MALSASEVYHLTVDKLRQVCSEQGLDSCGPVRVLRQRLADHIKSNAMDRSSGEDATQASVPTDLVPNVVDPAPPNSVSCSHGGGTDSQTPALVKLLRQVSPLSSEDPETLLNFFVRAEEIHDLGLVDDRTFVARILPLVSGGLLRFLGDCLRKGSGWVECKAWLLEEYFPYFIWERLVRDLIVFNFQNEGQSLRKHIEQVFWAANFLRYDASEQQLVDRIVMNFHPSILPHAAFLDRP